ncbi:molybdate ABC transporter substrate-binding protein [Tumebacillus sp. ITR2]|uniref:Molybdate ABC transporter substrate-binding protein n=1 Tax=Tumebacillus amylolyticus TaxID=2801339 RepID=A0ABS1JCR5_9BACL|nr:molybdate ABC transporter substrate-binding protein [Tumebacillus amylolyticus]MBL0388038.1 molybdate ABC transporter substrate-binding protein [Tumebacillus amylolyticus]
MKKRIAMLMAVSLVLLAGCSSQEPSTSTTPADKPHVTLTLSAAASLAKPLDTLTADYKKDHPEVEVTVNLGASGTLQKQIEQGAPADLFWSAGVAQMDALEKKELLADGTRQDVLKNELVLIRPKSGTVQTFEDLGKPAVKKIALGTPETVPAGKYAQEALTKLHLWAHVQEKAIFGKDVTSVLTYVEHGEVDAGLVYKTDALSSTQVDIVATSDESAHSPILYPLAILKNTQHLPEAKALEDYLHSAHAQEVLQKAGFALATH